MKSDRVGCVNKGDESTGGEWCEARNDRRVVADEEW